MKADSYRRTLTSFERRPPWTRLFLQVRGRARRTSVPPRPDMFQLDTARTVPDVHRGTSQCCSLLADKGKTDAKKTWPPAETDARQERHTFTPNKIRQKSDC